MSGLRKAKKYDWKDSNLALFGSDVEKNVRDNEFSIIMRCNYTNRCEFFVIHKTEH